MRGKDDEAVTSDRIASVYDGLGLCAPGRWDRAGGTAVRG